MNFLSTVFKYPFGDFYFTNIISLNSSVCPLTTFLVYRVFSTPPASLLQLNTRIF